VYANGVNADDREKHCGHAEDCSKRHRESLRPYRTVNNLVQPLDPPE
jgi:hypothetical protein